MAAFFSDAPAGVDTRLLYAYSCEIAKSDRARCRGGGSSCKCWGGQYSNKGDPVLGGAKINKGCIKFVTNSEDGEMYTYSKHIRCVTARDVRRAVERYGDDFPDALFRNSLCGITAPESATEDLRTRTTGALMAILNGTPLTEDQLALDGPVVPPPPPQPAAMKKRKSIGADSGDKKKAR